VASDANNDGDNVASDANYNVEVVDHDNYNKKNNKVVDHNMNNNDTD
jgi:hypothetical protein